MIKSHRKFSEELAKAPKYMIESDGTICPLIPEKENRVSAETAEVGSKYRFQTFMQLLETFEKESPLVRNPFEHSSSYDTKFSPLNSGLQ